MAKTRIIALNNNAGALVSVKTTIPCRRMEIIEDESVAPQGLIWQDKFETVPFATTKQCGASTEPLIFQSDAGPQTSGRGRLIGYGAQTDDHGQAWGADIILKVQSATAQTTKIRVTEYEA